MKIDPKTIDNIKNLLSAIESDNGARVDIRQYASDLEKEILEREVEQTFDWYLNSLYNREKNIKAILNTSNRIEFIKLFSFDDDTSNFIDKNISKIDDIIKIVKRICLNLERGK